MRRTFSGRRHPTTLVAGLVVLILTVSAAPARGGTPARAGTPGAVVRIDVAGDRVAARVPIGGGPSLVAADGRARWAPARNKSDVSVVSRDGGWARDLRHVAGPQTIGFAARRGRAYVPGDTNLKVIDPTRTPMVSTVSLSAIGGSADLVAAGPGGVWGVAGDTAFR